jgi:hypothetical protein
MYSFILARQKALSGRRVLDEYARRRRQRRQLDALEMDNFGDDPHANLAKAKKLPSFIDSPEGEIKITCYNHVPNIFC